jgi:uncharacterized membrane protein YbhN (UPF0104 family)
MARPAHARQRTDRAPLLTAVQVVVTLGLMAWLLSKGDADTVQTIMGANPWLIGAAAIIFTSAQVWGGLRLYALLADRRISAALAVRTTFVGYFFANFLPTTFGGDVVRAIRLRSAGVDLAQLAGALVLDRALNTILIAAIAVATTGRVARAFTVEMTALQLGGGAAVIAAAVLTAALVARRHPWLWQKLVAVSAPAFSLLRRPAGLAAVAFLTAANVFAGIAGSWLLALSMDIPLSLLEMAHIACVITLVGLIPISLNGIGLQEAGYVTFLTTLGVGEPQAVAFALAARLLILMASLVGGFAFILDRGFRPPASERKYRRERGD